MKREIKFRAWNGHNMFNNVQVGAMYLGDLIADPQWNLMQYTNLKDKNGRETYEGDIVKLHQVVLSPDDTIGWVEYTAQYGYSIRFGKRRCRQSNWATDEGAKYEVIGNIFENSDLLEVQHD
ncbi:YopX family protein [Schleiferilactobacillus harbinensis]|uniref:YopX protein domain-containing protein n=1 Tax=Schleiferilactobacillus harbinensis TaxID=304207 RepID=A0A5P8M534_9LACO|nr:YopX family protein [Schleiferilactobacillus harbinensis]QFR23211.1 hypothetical protein D1010_07240 [Schleiferilactobacillus harbinensis]QFR23713.1 hypothetical protein D1010_10010 [Schleiferilactobacillus harbinensis]